MKRLSFIILALLLCASVSFAGEPCKDDFCKAPTKLAMMTPMLGAGVSAAAPSFDWVETFNAGTSDKTWTDWLGTGDWTSGYSTTKIWSASNDLYTSSKRNYSAFTACNELYASIVFLLAGTEGSYHTLGIRDASGDKVGIKVDTWSTDHWTKFIVYYAGTSGTYAVMNISPNTIYWLLLHYKVGSGSNGVVQVYVTATQPTTGVGWGAAVVNITNNADTAQADRIDVGDHGRADAAIYDEIRMNFSSTVIYYD